MSENESDSAHGNGHEHAHGDEHEHGHGHGDPHGHVHEPGGEHAHARDHDHDHAPAVEVSSDRPLGPPRKRIAALDATFSYVDEGSGPVIVFLHGFPTSASLFRHVIGELSKGFRCIAPDLPGFGETDCPVDAGFGVKRQAERILAFLDALSLHEVALVAHDLGGEIAQVIVSTAPERLAKLVLVDCPAFGATPPVDVRRLALGARYSFFFDLLCDTGYMRWFARSSGGFRAGAYDPETISDEAIAEYIRPLYRDTPPAYRAGRERFRRALLEAEAERPDVLLEMADGLGRFEKPVLVVWGCDDPYISLSWGKKLADEIPGCLGLELIPFCGHWVPEEKPQVLAELVASHVSAPVAALAAAGSDA